MILIIDDYNIPHDIILQNFKLATATLLDPKIIKTKEFKFLLYFIHKETIEDISLVRYYFDEIYEIREKQLFYCNKKKNIYKIYNFKNNKFYEVKKEIQEDPDVKNINLNDVLPYLDVQNNISVDFPVDDEDDEI